MALITTWLAGFRNHWNIAKWRRLEKSPVPPPVRGYRTAISSDVRGRALLIYSPTPIANLERGVLPSQFNPGGAVVEIAHALNEEGLIVDVVDLNDTSFVLQEDYQLIVAHAGPAYRMIGDKIGPTCKVLDYSTGCYWRDYNEQSEARYHAFAERHGLRPSVSWARPLVVEYEDYAASRADLVVCLGPETARTFEPVARQVAHVNNAAYVSATGCLPRMTKSVRGSFLYSGGSGNIQKGLDILIEAFALEPDLHLQIDSPIEKDLLSVYQRQLSQPNLHYVEWQRKLPRGAQHIARRSAFSIYAGMNSGQSTALVASLAHGLVPVITREGNLGLGDLSVNIASPSVADVRASIRAAASLSLSEIQTRSEGVVAAFRERFSSASYRMGFRQAIRRLLSTC